MGEKTEKATPKKLQDARKKGQVAKSQDLPSAFTFITSIWVAMSLSSFMYRKVTDFIIQAFQLIPNPDLTFVIPNMYSEALLVIFTTTLPVLVIVAFIGVLINFLSIGPVFSFEVFKPDIKKFDMVKNLKGKFKMKTLFELCKSLFKVFFAAYLIYGVFYDSIPTLVKAVSMPMSSVLLIFHEFLMQVVVKVGLFFIVVAVLDFAYQRKNFAKEMKMEKFEVKQEMKNTEGDPQIKGKRKQIAQEIAYSEGPAAGVKKAKAVVTNPTHVAVAIGYEEEIDQAPYILAMGADQTAQEIIRAAKKWEVPIVQNVKIARRLWAEGGVFEYIPEDTYEVIAEVIRWVQALNTEAEYEYSDKAIEIE